MAKRRESTNQTAARSAKSPAVAKKRENAVHFRLPIEQIEKLDQLAEQNNITRAAVLQIATARILKDGI